MYIYTVWRQCG